MPPALWSTDGQWSVLLPVALALVLSVLVGLEREAGAGLRCSPWRRQPATSW